ncbi:hypothetical protein ACJMK2_011155 [Sinanodonta woodiana]|uniref:Uncharacterized protein n=1 Tax=Sinanodonta woodiana TaxID=1069815 RepID=A0ABD3V6E7_SINWO
MEHLEVNIRGSPAELSDYINRELLNIQVMRKTQLHHLYNRCLNHWYLNAITCLIQMTAFQWSNLVQLDFDQKDLFVVTHLFIFWLKYSHHATHLRKVSA